MAHYAGQKSCRQGFGGETRGKETTWEAYVRWEDNIKIDFQEVEWGGMDWIDLA